MKISLEILVDEVAKLALSDHLPGGLLVISLNF